MMRRRKIEDRRRRLQLTVQRRRATLRKGQKRVEGISNRSHTAEIHMAMQNEGKHSDTIRGLKAAGKNQIPLGDDHRFGRMFPDLDAAKFGKSAAQQERNLEKLADAMVSEFDKPKDGPDGEESGIPSLYTYLGQFIDHDLTFDPAASFQKQKDPRATEDFRTAAFDLDNVYGRGPGDQPYMYDPDGLLFTLGSPITGGHVKAHDLQRNPAGRALIGDPRNDENSIVSQLQGLFQQFHKCANTASAASRISSTSRPLSAGITNTSSSMTFYPASSTPRF
jgi:hypothetical protein